MKNPLSFEDFFQIRTLTWTNDELADKFDIFCQGVFQSVLQHFGLQPGND